MPLIHSKSKGAFAKNVKKEIAAGKPPKQAVAIAYATKRAAGGKDKAKSGDGELPKPIDVAVTDTETTLVTTTLRGPSARQSAS